jgi:hypothetical protein
VGILDSTGSGKIVQVQSYKQNRVMELQVPNNARNAECMVASHKGLCYMQLLPVAVAVAV